MNDLRNNPQLIFDALTAGGIDRGGAFGLVLAMLEYGVINDPDGKGVAFGHNGDGMDGIVALFGMDGGGVR